MPADTPTVPAEGRIDIHSHMLPGIDDGCQSVDESLASVRRLIEMGYVGTICTPHIWPELYPANAPDNIARWVDTLRRRIADAGLSYRLWTGGELRISELAVEWMKAEGVAPLAGSRCVLCDFWAPEWPRWVDSTFEWLLSEGYQPILAHPERLAIRRGLAEHLTRWTDRGVLLQGNFRCLTGDEGDQPESYIRQWLDEDRYTFFALDMHRPNTLESRLAGIEIVTRLRGTAFLDEAIVHAPRRIIFDAAG